MMEAPQQVLAVNGSKAKENGYIEVELDSSRGTTFNSSRGCADLEQVIVKLTFLQGGSTLELPLEGKKFLDMTVKQLKNDQFTHEERQSVTLVHDGCRLNDNERLFDLLTPMQRITEGSLSSPKVQYIQITVVETTKEAPDEMTKSYGTFDPLRVDTYVEESSGLSEEMISPTRTKSLKQTNRNSDSGKLPKNRKSNPNEVTPRGKKV